jgi:hypothetical protein
MGVTTAWVAPTIKASGKTFANLQALGVAQYVEAMISAHNVVATAPTAAPTATATGGGATGGLLAAGTYYIKITEHNGIGESTASPESSQLTVASTNIPRVAFPTLKTGNTARNVYITAAGGATNTEKLYAAGITAGTYDLAVAAPASTVTPPATGDGFLSDAQIALVRLMVEGKTFQGLVTLVQSYLRGDPISTTDYTQKLTDYAVVYALISSMTNELGTLVFVTPGSIVTYNHGSGSAQQKRTLP